MLFTIVKCIKQNIHFLSVFFHVAGLLSAVSVLLLFDCCCSGRKMASSLHESLVELNTTQIKAKMEMKKKQET